MKKLLIFLLTLFLSSCAFLRAQEQEQEKIDKEEELYIIKLICDSNSLFQHTERMYFKNTRNKDTKEQWEEEKIYLQQLLNQYEQKYEKEFSWKNCKKSSKRSSKITKK